MSNQRWILAVPWLLAMNSWGGEFWATKPYTSWTSADVQAMITRSPWAALVKVGTSNSGDRVYEACPGDMDGFMPASDCEIYLQRKGICVECPVYAVLLWQSALPIRQAFVQRKYGVDAPAEAKRTLEDSPTYYVVRVAGLPLEAQIVSETDKRTLVNATSLTTSSNRRVVAQAVDLSAGDAFFFFPRSASFTEKDKSLKFATKFRTGRGAIKVTRKFDLLRMSYNGELKL